MQSYCDSEQTIWIIIKTNGVQCLYYVLHLKQLVWNACTMCYAQNDWCEMLVLCVIFKINGVQCLYYVLYLKQMVCNACTMWYTQNNWCEMLVLCLKMLNNTCAKISAELGVMLLKQFRVWSRSKDIYYLFVLSLSNGLNAELRAHFYDTIAQKRLPCLYLFFTSLLLVIVYIVFTLPSSFHS